MARTGPDGPTGRAWPADRAWPAAVALGLALVAGAYLLALVWPMLFGPCPCRDPDGRPALVVATSRDLWVAVAAARYVASGALGFVYESTPALTALPLYPVLLAPLVAAGDALGLSGPPAPAATLYLLLVPFTVGLAVPLLDQVGGLLRDAGDRGPALAAQAWTVLLALVPALVLYGHGEDALALLALVGAVRLAGRGRWAAAGLALGVAVASKQWALLALPALVAWSPRRERPRLVAAGLALPAALAVLVLAVDWPHASRALLHPPNYPGFGHAAPWVDAGLATVVTAPFRLGALALAGLLAGRVRAGSSWSRLLAVLGLALFARWLFEPVVHVYYLAPGLCLLLAHERVATGHCRRTPVAGGLLVGWFAVHPAPGLWWAVAALLGAAVAYPAACETFSRAGSGAIATSRRMGPGRARTVRETSATGNHQ
jgi:hypothetical protein